MVLARIRPSQPRPDVAQFRGVLEGTEGEALQDLLGRLPAVHPLLQKCQELLPRLDKRAPHGRVGGPGIQIVSFTIFIAPAGHSLPVLLYEQERLAAASLPAPLNPFSRHGGRPPGDL